jgi:hypothetical protein
VDWSRARHTPLILARTTVSHGVPLCVPVVRILVYYVQTKQLPAGLAPRATAIGCQASAKPVH